MGPAFRIGIEMRFKKYCSFSWRALISPSLAMPLLLLTIHWSFSASSTSIYTTPSPQMLFRRMMRLPSADHSLPFIPFPYSSFSLSAHSLPFKKTNIVHSFFTPLLIRPIRPQVISTHPRHSFIHCVNSLHSLLRCWTPPNPLLPHPPIGPSFFR